MNTTQQMQPVTLWYKQPQHSSDNAAKIHKLVNALYPVTGIWREGFRDLPENGWALC